MPELPEVETIRKELTRRVKGSEIRSARVLRSDVVAYPSVTEFASRLAFARIEAVSRQAKYLIFKLDNGMQLIFHLRLSGAIVVCRASIPLRHSRIILYLKDGRTIQFVEPRVLGRAYLIRDGERIAPLKGFFKLGKEPIAQDFDFNYLYNLIKRRKARIKSLLLDQRIAAGVGNIYSDEALFRARIRPTRRAGTLTRHEVRRLVRALKEVIRDGIKNLGTSVKDYYRTDGQTGNFQNLLNVYGREHEECHICMTRIRLVKFGNRGSRYCPGCQR